jgi:RNA-directed DNA polymerase
METNYLSINREKRKWRRKKGLANFLYVRYADDWIVLCNGTKAQALAMKEELKGVLKNMG